MAGDNCAALVDGTARVVDGGENNTNVANATAVINEVS